MLIGRKRWARFPRCDFSRLVLSVTVTVGYGHESSAVIARAWHTWGSSILSVCLSLLQLVSVKTPPLYLLALGTRGWALVFF